MAWKYAANLQGNTHAEMWFNNNTLFTPLVFFLGLSNLIKQLRIDLGGVLIPWERFKTIQV